MPEGRDELGGAPGDLLVFVFAVTQVTTLLAERPSWGRFGESMLALALVWWAWSAFVWAANAQTTGSRATGPICGRRLQLSPPGHHGRDHHLRRGVKLVVHNSVQAPMPGPGHLALCVRVAVYLLGLGAFRLRVFGELGYGRVAAALGLIALFALGASIPAGRSPGSQPGGRALSERVPGRRPGRGLSLRSQLAAPSPRLVRGLTIGVRIPSSWGRRCSCIRGSFSASPRWSGSSSTAKPGESVAISNRIPRGSGK